MRLLHIYRFIERNRTLDPFIWRWRGHLISTTVVKFRMHQNLEKNEFFSEGYRYPIIPNESSLDMNSKKMVQQKNTEDKNCYHQ